LDLNIVTVGKFLLSATEKSCARKIFIAKKSLYVRRCVADGPSTLTGLLHVSTSMHSRLKIRQTIGGLNAEKGHDQDGAQSPPLSNGTPAPSVSAGNQDLAGNRAAVALLRGLSGASPAIPSKEKNIFLISASTLIRR